MLAKLRLEIKGNSFLLSRLTDIESGIDIPIRSLKIVADIDDPHHEILAEIVVPITEVLADEIYTKLILETERIQNVEI